MANSTAPAASISSRTIRSAFFSARSPSGRYVYAPAITWLTSPARSINTWLGISAPSGVSFMVGISVRVQNIAEARGERELELGAG